MKPKSVVEHYSVKQGSASRLRHSIEVIGTPRVVFPRMYQHRGVYGVGIDTVVPNDFFPLVLGTHF